MHRKADEEAIPVGMDDEDPGPLRNRAAISWGGDNAARCHLGPADLGELSVVTTRPAPALAEAGRADLRTGRRCRLVPRTRVG
jgi:hypothetical protein